MADEERPRRDDSRRPAAGRPARDGERKPYAKRDGERKPYTPREGERKPYAPRDGERKPYAPRDGERKQDPRRDGERPSYPKRDGERKSYAPRDGERKSYAPRDGERKPYAPRDGDRKPYAPRDGERKPYGARPPAGRRDDDRRASRPPQGSDRRTGEAGPVLPADVTPQDLASAARNELKTLSKENAEQVARHLAMAARLIDDDPQLAHQHALAASRSAGRIAVVRETVAITAYAIGDFALAVRELRTFRRISGRDDQIALLVDSERGVGRPDRALEVGRAVDRAALPVEVRVELAIAMSGARLDLGENERALQELEIPELDPDHAFSWSPGLFAARAAVLEELGRLDEAAQWQRRAEIAEDVIGSRDADSETLLVEEIEEIEEIEELELDDDADEPPSAPASEPDDAPTTVQDEVDEILADAGIDADGDGDVEPDDADENPSAR